MHDVRDQFNGLLKGHDNSDSAVEEARQMAVEMGLDPDREIRVTRFERGGATMAEAVESQADTLAAMRAEMGLQGPSEPEG